MPPSVEIPDVSEVLAAVLLASEGLRIRVALSILEKLQVPDGWMSSGLSAKLYTWIASIGTFVWCWNGYTSVK